MNCESHNSMNEEILLDQIEGQLRVLRQMLLARGPVVTKEDPNFVVPLTIGQAREMVKPLGKSDGYYLFVKHQPVRWYIERPEAKGIEPRVSYALVDHCELFRYGKPEDKYETHFPVMFNQLTKDGDIIWLLDGSRYPCPPGYKHVYHAKD